MEWFRYVWCSPVLRTLGLTFAFAGIGGHGAAARCICRREKLRKTKEFLLFLMIVNGGAMLIGGGLIANCPGGVEFLLPVGVQDIPDRLLFRRDET